MKSLLICAVALVVLAVAAAGFTGYKGKIYPAKPPYYERQRGPKSSGADDSESVARCNNYYQIGNCSCSRSGNCDGSFQFMDDSGPKCVGFNRAEKPGIYAFAHCFRFVLNVESETGTDPEASCPEGFLIYSCMLHSYRQENHPTCYADMDGGKCIVKGCGKDQCTKCRMQARCIREGKWMDDQDTYEH